MRFIILLPNPELVVLLVLVVLVAVLIVLAALLLRSHRVASGGGVIIEKQETKTRTICIGGTLSEPSIPADDDLDGFLPGGRGSPPTKRRRR